MKLSSKEMIILAVFLSIVIIVAGLFLFILPEYEKIEPNKNSLQAEKDALDQVYASLAREATIDQEIDDAIQQANTISLSFYDEMTTYEADVLVREILEATNMSTKGLSLSDYSTQTLTVTDYVETIITYPLKQYSGFIDDRFDAEELAASVSYDEDGNLVIPEDFKEKYVQALKEYMTALLSTQSQTVGAVTVNFTIEGTRGDFLKFLDYVAGLEKATIINSTNVAYTGTETNTANAAAPAEGEEGAPVQANTTPVERVLNDNSEISTSVSMTFYCITPMSTEEFTVAAEAEPEAEPAA